MPRDNFYGIGGSVSEDRWNEMFPKKKEDLKSDEDFIYLDVDHATAGTFSPVWVNIAKCTCGHEAVLHDDLYAGEIHNGQDTHCRVCSCPAFVRAIDKEI